MKSFAFLIVFFCLLMLSGFIRMMFPTDINLIIYGILGCAAGYLTLFAFLKIEKRSWAEFGVSWDRHIPRRFLLGIGIGVIVMAVVIVSLVSLTALRIRFEPSGFDTRTGLFVLQVFLLALMEEIGFRTYAQQELNKKYGLWVSQIFMALAFGAYHILNGWPIQIAFGGPFVWAFLFGLSAILSGGIAMPTGIHFALNILQALVGQKSGHGSLWKLDYPPGTSQALMAKTDNVGFVLHGVLLILFLGATYYYNRRVKHSDQAMKHTHRWLL